MVVSGPEGGLSAEEESGLLQRGLQPVSLGVRVLRAETAAIAAVTRLVLA
jgi:16S rRNA (uracil1498-N3)-methyltransferase